MTSSSSIEGVGGEYRFGVTFTIYIADILIIVRRRVEASSYLPSSIQASRYYSRDSATASTVPSYRVAATSLLLYSTSRLY